MPQWSYDAEGNLVYVNEDGSTTSYGPTPPVETVAPPTPTPPPAPEVDPGQSESYSFSYSGYDPARERQARTSREQAFAGIDRQAAEDFTRLGKPTVYAAQKRMDAVGTDEELAGAPSLYAAESSKMRKEAQLTAFMADQERRYANEELNAQAATEAVVNKAKAELISEVQAFKTMKVDPNAWFQDSSSATKGATLISAFAAGFLNAGGIQNDIMGTLNRAIDRSIDAQRFNIQKQGQTVDMFGQLYQMAVQKSATDAEARLRVRAMLRESAKTAVLAELMRYDAPIAQAKAAEAHSMFLDQLNKDLIQLDGMLNQRAQAAKQLYLQGVQADLEAAKFSFAKSQAAAEQAAREAAAGQVGPEILKDGIWDPETGGYFGWVGHLSDTEKKWTRDQFEGAAQMQRLAKEYQDLQRRMDPLYNGPAGKISKSQFEAWVRSSHSRYISAKTLYLSGKAATNIERKSIEEQFPLKTWLVSDVGKAISAEVAENQADIKATAGGRVLRPEDLVRQGMMTPQAYQKLMQIRGGGGGQGFMPTSHAMGVEANDDLDGNSGSPVNSPVDTAFKEAESPTSDKDKGYQKAATVAYNEAVRSGSPEPLVGAIKKMESVVFEGRGGADHQQAVITLDYLVRKYESLTGELPPGRAGELARKEAAERESERVNFVGTPDLDPRVIEMLGQE